MPAPTDIPARGKVVAAREGGVVFAPSGTNYELDLLSPQYAGGLNVLTDGVVRVTARKILTVPSGGNFISPIFGTPRTIQGRVRTLDETSMVVQAGAPILIEYPSAESAFDLVNGPIAAGALVNAMILPGARFEKTT